MKLVIVLSVIAYSYAAKLDRTYLPPASAATAGGSPGSLTAPGAQSQAAFGQGLPISSGIQHQGSNGLGLNSVGQSGASGNGQKSPGSNQLAGSVGTGSLNAGVNSNGFGVNAGAVSPGATYGQYGSRPSAYTGLSPSQPQNFGTQTGISQTGFSSNQGLGQSAQSPITAQAYKPERAQAEADRNAEIIRYENENNGESYTYNYETSNGIAAEESGVATNGVKAQGGYSYTADDGKAYAVTYTADENGFQPQGEHLPTPHPIPEEILKSIEDNAKAAAEGTQEGAYRPEEYESKPSAQQNNNGYNFATGYQGQSQGISSGSASINQGLNNQLTSSQGSSQGSSGIFGQNRPGSLSGQYNQASANKGQGQFGSDLNGLQGPSDKYQQSFGSQGPAGQLNSQGQLGQGIVSSTQGQGNNGYKYNQPQNAFGSPSQQKEQKLQQNTLGQSNTFGSGQNNNLGTFGSSFGTGSISPNSISSSSQSRPGTSGSQSQAGSSDFQSQPDAPSSQYLPGSSSSQYQLTSSASSKETNRPQVSSQYRPESNTFGNNNQNGQTNQFTANPTFGSSVVSPNQGSQYKPGKQGFGSDTSSQGYQYQKNANRPSLQTGNGLNQGNQQNTPTTSNGFNQGNQQVRPQTGNGFNQGNQQVRPQTGNEFNEGNQQVRPQTGNGFNQGNQQYTSQTSNGFIQGNLQNTPQTTNGLNQGTQQKAPQTSNVFNQGFQPNRPQTGNGYNQGKQQASNVPTLGSSFGTQQQSSASAGPTGVNSQYTSNQPTFGSNVRPSGSASLSNNQGSDDQGYHYQRNGNRPFNTGFNTGSTPSNQQTFGSNIGSSQTQTPGARPSFGSNSGFSQAVKQPSSYEPNAGLSNGAQGSRPTGFNAGINQGISQFTSGNQAFATQPTQGKKTYGSTAGSTQGQDTKPSFGNGYSQAGSQAGAAKQPTFGSNQYTSGNGPAFGSNAGSIQAGQQSTQNTAFGSSLGPNQGASPFSQGNKPSFGSNNGFNQGTSQFGSGSRPSDLNRFGANQSKPTQAAYQYNRPGQSPQSQSGFNPAESLILNGKPSQGNQATLSNQDRSEQFGGPRQPPSFSPEEGYKY